MKDEQSWREWRKSVRLSMNGWAAISLFSLVSGAMVVIGFLASNQYLFIGVAGFGGSLLILLFPGHRARLPLAPMETEGSQYEET